MSLFRNPAPEGDTFAQDRQDKQKFVIMGLMVLIIYQLFSIPIKFYNGRALEAFLDVLFIFTITSFISLSLKERFAGLGHLLLVCLLMGGFFYGFFMKGHEDSSILLFFTFPGIVFYLVGIRRAAWGLAIVLIPVLVLLFWPSLFPIRPFGASFVLHYLTSFCLTLGVCGIVEWLHSHALMELHTTNDHLNNATERIQTLGRLIPICSYCKRMKDKTGYWMDLGRFLSENTKAQVSYGLCETCSQEPASADSDNPLPDEPAPNLLTIPSDFHPLFVLLASLVVSVTTAAFSIRDLIMGNVTKAVVQMIFVVIISLVSFLKWRKKGPSIANHIVVLGIFLVVALPYFGQRPEFVEIVWFFLFPPLAIYITGATMGSLWSLLLLAFAQLVFLQVSFLSTVPYTAPFHLFFSVSFLVLVFLSWNSERLRGRIMATLLNRRKKLELAYENIHSLKGLVPVCAKCHSIRNDEGFWTNVEKHFHDFTDLQLTHGICRDCMKREFPEIWAHMSQQEKDSTAKVPS
ncbi:hypothetical protein KKF84_12710 [Myxococcota bacterium]|nr:hypothetical protein [Myxococcota bacterium]